MRWGRDYRAVTIAIPNQRISTQGDTDVLEARRGQSAAPNDQWRFN